MVIQLEFWNFSRCKQKKKTNTYITEEINFSREYRLASENLSFCRDDEDDDVV